MKYLTSLFLLIALSVCNLQAQQPENKEKYFQDVKTEILLPPEAGNNVIKLFSANQSELQIMS